MDGVAVCAHLWPGRQDFVPYKYFHYYYFYENLNNLVAAAAEKKTLL